MAKIVDSPAAPIAPPTCWEVLAIPDATPASARSTRAVAVKNAGEGSATRHSTRTKPLNSAAAAASIAIVSDAEHPCSSAFENP